MRPLLVFIGLMVCTELGGTIVSVVFEVKNLFVYNIYIVASYFIITAIFYQQFEHKIIRRALLIVACIYGLYSVLNLLVVQGFFVINSFSLTVESILIISLALVSFAYIFQKVDVIHLEKYAMFWIAAAMLYYYASNLFLFMFSGHLLIANPPKELVGYFTIINTANNFVFNVLLFIAIWTGRTQQQSIQLA